MRHQLSLALALATSACVNNASSGVEDTAEVQSNLELENGGLDTSDELPQFGEQDVFTQAQIEQDAPAADPMATDPAIAELDTSTAARHRVLIAWGKMPADPTATDGRDWSGSLRLSRGGMIIGRTVGFESATDHVAPRTARDLIEFTSVTRPFADGLALRVIDPDPASADALTLTYHSNVTNQDYSLDLAQLAAGPVSIDAGNGFRVVAVSLRDRDCDHGFLRGRWVALRENLGVYRGLIVNADGEVTGHIRGIWGQRRNGDKVMFGKFIATDGTFRGLVAGTYDAGQFHARWLTSAGDHGMLGGVYFDAPNVRGGVFMGRWAEASCAQ
jgi:hypothetical protein